MWREDRAAGVRGKVRPACPGYPQATMHNSTLTIIKYVCIYVPVEIRSKCLQWGATLLKSGKELRTRHSESRRYVTYRNLLSRMDRYGGRRIRASARECSEFRLEPEQARSGFSRAPHRFRRCASCLSGADHRAAVGPEGRDALIRWSSRPDNGGSTQHGHNFRPVGKPTRYLLIPLLALPPPLGHRVVRGRGCALRTVREPQSTCRKYCSPP